MNNDRVYLDYSRVEEFLNRCEIALFLKYYHNEIIYSDYIGKRCFEATIDNDTVMVSLFGTPDADVIEKHYSIRKTTDNQPTKLRVYKLVSRASVFNNIEVDDYTFISGFKDEYIKLYRDNPLHYIVHNLFGEKGLINYAGLTEFSEIPSLWCSDDVLYKYKSFPNRDLKEEKYAFEHGIIQDFIDGSLTYTNPEKFNDPFDCDCDIPVLYHVANKLKTKVKKEKRNSISDDDITKMIDSIVSRLSGEFTDPSELFKRMVEELVSRFISEGLLKEDEAVNAIKEIKTGYLSIKELFRVLCMSSHYDDILMWGYYGGYGSGLCGGFTKKAIVDAFEDKSNFILICGKVKYSNDSQKPKYTRGSILQYVLKCVFTKYSIWKHEGETRYLLLSPECTNDYYGVKTVCSERYLGVNASDDDVNDYVFASRPLKLSKHSSEYKLILTHGGRG